MAGISEEVCFMTLFFLADVFLKALTFVVVWLAFLCVCDIIWKRLIDFFLLVFFFKLQTVSAKPSA